MSENPSNIQIGEEKEGKMADSHLQDPDTGPSTRPASILSEDPQIPEGRIETSPKEKLHAVCKSAAPHDGSNILNVPLTKVYSSKNGEFHQHVFGQNVTSVPEKVLLIVGETGTGKTTLINAIVNHYFGVSWEDKFKFRLIDESHVGTLSQTSSINSYTIPYMGGDMPKYNLTIVETPGFGHTSGTEEDKIIVKQMEDFFRTNGLYHVDAIGFVVKASDTRLTPAQRYVYNQVLCLFGKDVEQNIIIMATFSDGTISCLDSLTEAKVPCTHVYSFNNSMLYGDRANKMGSMFWSMAHEEYIKLFDDMYKFQPASLAMTRDVLERRIFLLTAIEALKDNLKDLVKKQDEYIKTLDAIKMHKSNIDASKGFQYAVTESQKEKALQEEKGEDIYATNCTSCQRTCHPQCFVLSNKLEYFCSMMSWGGTCKVCDCGWLYHKVDPYIWKYVDVEVEQKTPSLLAKFSEANKGKAEAEACKQNLEECLKIKRENLAVACSQVTLAQKELNKIVLITSDSALSDYIDLLIADERRDMTPGFQDRIVHYNDLKVNAENAEFDQERWLDRTLSKLNKKEEDVLPPITKPSD